WARTKAAGVGAQGQGARIHVGRGATDAGAGRQSGRAQRQPQAVLRADQAPGAAQARDRAGAGRIAAHLFVILCPHRRWQGLSAGLAQSLMAPKFVSATLPSFARGDNIMPSYQAPVEDVRFLLNDVFHIDRHANLPGFADASPDVVEAILSEAARF